jgi:hypothetical protein
MESRVGRVRQPKGGRGAPDDAPLQIAHAHWRENPREDGREAYPDVLRGPRGRGDRPRLVWV